jgi:hypothetical protein
MPHIQHRPQIVLLTLFLVILMAIACSNDTESSSDPSSVSNVGNFESCEGFLTADHIGAATSSSGLVDRIQVIAIGSIPGLAESGAVRNCLIEVFRTIDGSDSPAPGDSVTLSLVDYETSERALLLYNSTLASAILTAEQVGDLAEIRQEVVGEDSYLMDVKIGGIGAIVVFVSGSTFISMSSTADDESNALLDGQELVSAAQSVQSRLP